MKKILSLTLVMIAGATISFAQTATKTSTTSSTSTEEVQSSTPAVKAVGLNQSVKKCSAESKACCPGGSKASAATTTTATDLPVAAEKAEPGSGCHAVSIGTSAVKPETATVVDPEK